MNTLSNYERSPDLFQAEDDGMVHTTSHLRMWRLTILDSYRVVSTGVIPRTSVFGRIRYTRVWDLMPSKQTSRGTV